MQPVEVVERLLDGSGFGRLVKRVDDLISKECGDYLELISGRAAPSDGNAKAFKDSIWGMVDLTGRELVTLDSPPMQRLRRIRQMGLTFVTYPTAGYSRFEHSLGAIHQAERMLRTVALRSSPEAKPLIDAARPVVRLAAMLHDVGHMPLSHVSERAFGPAECLDNDVLDEIDGWRSDIANLLDVPAPRLAECLSLALVLTESFRAIMDDAGYTDVEAAEAALAIVGRAPSLQRAFVAQLVTNVIDADKLDYMFRDSAVTRVPLGVDLERLLYKLKCVNVAADDLPPKGRLRMLAQQGERAWVLGTDLAGMRLAYDLALARTMLFERIYLHHKTRAAERLAITIVRGLGLHPAELLTHDDGIFSQYSSYLQGAEQELAYLLRLRQLPRRAFAVGYSLLLATAPITPKGGKRLSQQELDGWGDLEEALDDAASRQALEERILERARELAESVGCREEIRRVWLDPLPNKHLHSDDPELLLERPDTSTDAGAAFPAEAAAFAHSPASTTYVYAETSTRGLEVVHLAAELELARHFGLVFGRWAADHAKVDFEVLQTRKRTLEAKQPEVYEQYARLRPRSKLLRTGDRPERVRVLADRFHQYHADAEVRVTDVHIRQFIDQFPEGLVEAALTMLEHIKFVDRDDLGRRFLTFVADTADSDAVLVPLTPVMEKSAAHMTYYFGDSSETRAVLPLAQALQTDSPLVVYDDVLLSGTQAVDTLRVWCGEDQELDEDLGSPLTVEELDSVRGRSVQFRFAYGYEVGIERLTVAAGERGLGNDVKALDVAPEQSFLNDMVGGADLREYLRAIGQQLLLSTRHREDPERCADRALGYGNSEQLVVLPYNTPTGTLTALWKSGTYGSAPWLPLVPRRGELGEPER